MRDPKITHKIMSSIKSKGTRPEITLRKALWKSGIRYRINYKKLPGRPDIAITKYKVAIFVDGDYWHGHNWALRGLASLEAELQTYTPYWQEKIRKNVERDMRNDQSLCAMDWMVIRIWESDIKKDLASCVQVIKEMLFEEKIKDLDSIAFEINDDM